MSLRLNDVCIVHNINMSMYRFFCSCVTYENSNELIMYFSHIRCICMNNRNKKILFNVGNKNLLTISIS